MEFSQFEEYQNIVLSILTIFLTEISVTKIPKIQYSWLNLGSFNSFLSKLKENFLKLVTDHLDDLDNVPRNSSSSRGRSAS